MEVMIYNFSADTSKLDLLDLLKSYRKHMELKMVDNHYEDGSTFHFALASFKSDKHALKVIKKFNNVRLKGHHLIVREYVHRSYSNEKRALNWRQQPWDGVERRGHDRRRKEVVKKHDDLFDETPATEENIRIAGYRNFARKG